MQDDLHGYQAKSSTQALPWPHERRCVLSCHLSHGPTISAPAAPAAADSQPPLPRLQDCQFHKPLMMLRSITSGEPATCVRTIPCICFEDGKLDS
jgi:hypothetical protein